MGKESEKGIELVMQDLCQAKTFVVSPRQTAAADFKHGRAFILEKESCRSRGGAEMVCKGDSDQHQD